MKYRVVLLFRVAKTLKSCYDKLMSSISASDNPFDVFSEWQKEAISSQDYLDGAMALATATLAAAPSLRMVLLKEFTSQGFIFFTNYESRKGLELKTNPTVALLFYWPRIGKQVRIEGRVDPMSRTESELYFRSRNRENQLGAWASAQSQEIPDRDALLKRKDSLKAKYAKQEIPCPPHWGGFRVTPHAFEFWINQAGRLHDRFSFQINGPQWTFKRLSP